jgi:PAS domain S-box-containing protein
LDACTDHVYVYDRQGRYLHASTSGAQALGLEPEELIGKNWRELNMPAEIMEPFHRELMKVLNGGPSLRREVAYPTVEGLQLFEYILNPLIDDGEIVGAVAFVRDVTHLRASETAGDSNRELEPSSPAPGRFVPLCSSCHDIGTDDGRWLPVAEYLKHQLPAMVSESNCPRCLRRLKRGQQERS